MRIVAAATLSMALNRFTGPRSGFAAAIDLGIGHFLVTFVEQEFPYVEPPRALVDTVLEGAPHAVDVLRDWCLERQASVGQILHMTHVPCYHVMATVLGDRPVEISIRWEYSARFHVHALDTAGMNADVDVSLVVLGPWT